MSDIQHMNEAWSNAAVRLNLQFTLLNRYLDGILAITKKTKMDKGDDGRMNGFILQIRNSFVQIDTVFRVFDYAGVRGFNQPWLAFKNAVGNGSFGEAQNILSELISVAKSL